MRHAVFAGWVGAIVGLAALASAAGTPALAQTADDPVAACRAAHASDLAQRVACLELAIERMRGQAPAPEARGERPAWSIPGFRAREQAEREQENEAVRVRIVRVTYGRDGLGRFVTEEGQTWRETVAAPERRWLENGRTYEGEISRGPIGGFRLNIDGIRFEYRVEPID